MTNEKKIWDWKKTAKKFAVDAVIIFFLGLLVVIREDPRWLVFAPIIKGFIDYLKHRN